MLSGAPPLPELLDPVLIEPEKRYRDQRGWFSETFSAERLRALGISCAFVQDNESFSRYGVIRGLHFQRAPHAQAKLVRAVTGAILDVCVDIRAGSPAFGKVFYAELSSENRRQLFIPEGFAHGFAVLSETALVAYKCSRGYAPAAEGSIHPEDPDLGISWRVPLKNRIYSEKDRAAPSFAAYSTRPAFRCGKEFPA